MSPSYEGAQIWTHQHTTPDVLSPGLRGGEGSPPSACWLQSAQEGQAQGTKYLQGWRFRTTSGKSVQMFDHSHVKENFLAYLLRSSFVPMLTYPD